LYSVAPSIIVCLKGHSPVSAQKHVLERLRCALCGSVFTASPPNGVKLIKYDESVKAAVGIAKCYIGVPMKRLETWQNMVGVPLKDATQWDILESLADDIHPIFTALKHLAAQGKVIRHDDTSVRILSLIKENKKLSKDDRRGMYTTGILSDYQGKQIALFFSGRKHSGENMTELLSQRSPELSKVIRMCDALSSNLSTPFEEFLCNCLSHGRRKFYELTRYLDQEFLIVLKSLGFVYHQDHIAQKKEMSDQERLEHHQKHSAPVMEDLKIWIDKQIEDKLVEPNSSLGKALNYMQNHWEGLTCFLRIPGAPLDNNKVEGLLKIMIRGRKNSLFYKTEHGALIGSMLTSIIQTCVMAGENPFEYLVILQQNKRALFKSPQDWLPWNYRVTLGHVNQKSQSPPALAA
jgi:transposase